MSTPQPMPTVRPGLDVPPPIGVDARHWTSIADASQVLYVEIMNRCPASRQRSLALTGLEQAVMWAYAHLFRNPPALHGQGLPRPPEPKEGPHVAFGYEPPAGVASEHFEPIRDAADRLLNAVLDRCAHSRERSLAMTNLEQSLMWCNAALFRYGPPPPQTTPTS